MQVIYMKSDPIQHSGVPGREIPMAESNLFTEDESARMFQAAVSMDRLFNNMFRMSSVEEAYAELKVQLVGIKGPNPELERRIIRRVRSYILEYDIFLKHWERYFAKRVKDGKRRYKEITHPAFDDNEAYALICTLRNYLVHSDDIVHGQHIGFDGFGLWADRALIINDMDWPNAKRNLLQRQPEKIDILKLIDDSLEPIKDVHDKLIECLLTEEVKEDCDYLNSMFGRTIPVKSVAWYIWDFKGHELVPGCTAEGVGANFIQLNWQGYRAMKEYIDNIYSRAGNGEK